ncbi:MAG: hypothetical protein AAB534_01460 [Patescibacteria group bacterium]
MTTQAIRDFFWVLQAFIRGKVFHQTDYVPGPNAKAFIMSLVRPSWRIRGSFSVGRIATLMRWWGPQMMTKRQIHDLESLAAYEHEAFKKVPFLFWYENETRLFCGVADPGWIELREMEVEANS